MVERPTLSPEQRRARHAERREKQRRANLGCAAKMHKARLKAGAMPATHDEPSRINIGCSGWYYWHWAGKFYPDGMDRKLWFPHYAQHFNTVELNAPFYSWPTLATVQSWNRRAEMVERDGEPFLYTVKVNELITHSNAFIRTGDRVRDFTHIADILGHRMGCFLFQLPASHHYSTGSLNRITAQLASIPPAKWSSSVIKAGGTTAPTPPSSAPTSFSVRPAARAFPTTSSKPPTTFTSAPRHRTLVQA